MKTYSFADKATGLFIGRTFSTDDERLVQQNLELNPDHLPVEGKHDHLSKRYDHQTQTVVEHQPPRPSVDHEWDDDIKRWKLTAAAAATKQTKVDTLAEIARLEASQGRTLREAILDPIGGLQRLKDLNDKITKLRAEL